MRPFHRLLFCLLLTTTTAAYATDIHVGDFGAVPNDGNDDAPAIRAALDACRKVKNPRLLFAPGVYHVKTTGKSRRAFFNITRFPSITICGDRTEIISNDLAGMFYFEECGDVRVSGLDIDIQEDALPFAGGRVVATGDGTIDVEIAPGHPLREIPVQAFQTFNNDTLAAHPPSHRDYFFISQRRYDKPAQIISPNVLRIFVNPSPEILRVNQKKRTLPLIGNHLIIWYVVRSEGRAIRSVNSGNLAFEDVRIFAASDMGLTALSCKSARLLRCSIMPRPGTGRWMSTTVDATHFNMLRDRVELIDCVFEAMGDDGSNVHGIYTMVHERTDNRTLVMRGNKTIFGNPGLKESDRAAPPPGNSLRPGDTLEFSTNDNPLVPVFDAKILDAAWIEVGKIKMKRITLDRDLPVYVQNGTVVGNASETPEFVMRNCTVRRNRGCGMRLKTRNALIENCTFEDLSGAGIWVTCDATVDFESTATRNVTIRNNTIRNAHTALSVTAGRTESYPDVHENILIEGNRIESPWPVAIRIESTKGAVVRGNTIQAPGDEPILVKLSSDVRVENNTVKRLR